ncbi:MAG: Abi family protein [Endomicrobiaceae bacterium]|nr:Abi family protein [Endomicrobiaceae bacterium]
MQKIYMEISDMINQLQSRGMIISDYSFAEETIKKENYYKLINGYKELFIDKSCSYPTETYKNGTNFNEIVTVYNFDQKLKNIFIKKIFCIENNVKSIVATVFSKKYGHQNYLKISNFDCMTDSNPPVQSKDKICDIINLMASLQNEISKQLNKNNLMITHYLLKYGYIPLWVLVNILSFGTISIFYGNMKKADQNDVARSFNTKPEIMKTFLHNLTIYRNACAHDERLYSLKTLKRNGKPNCIAQIDIHSLLSIPKLPNGNLQYGVNDLYSVVIIFKKLLYKDRFDSFIDSLSYLVDELKNKLSTISINDVLDKMGFPINWLDIKAIK